MFTGQLLGRVEVGLDPIAVTPVMEAPMVTARPRADADDAWEEALETGRSCAFLWCQYIMICAVAQLLRCFYHCWGHTMWWRSASWVHFATCVVGCAPGVQLDVHVHKHCDVHVTCM